MAEGALARQVARKIERLSFEGDYEDTAWHALVEPAIQEVLDAEVAERVGVLWKALEFYGDWRNHTPDVMDHWPSKVSQDGGVIARAALATAGAPDTTDESTQGAEQ